MTKLYYTDPLAAAYMAREFGVEIISSIYDDGSFYGFVVPEGTLSGIYYISHESMHIFVPQVGDLVCIVEGSLSTYKIVDDISMGKDRIRGKDEIIHGIWNDGRYWRLFRKDWSVTKRNGKPFFWPESEES